MLFGDFTNNFTATVNASLDQGYNISHVLAFNEPDQGSGVGGSSLSPAKAAARWIKDIEPLRARGVKLGAPAVSNLDFPGGGKWMQDFFTACNGSCHSDFMPLHYYGTAQGIYDFIYNAKRLYGNNHTFWVTEYNNAHAPLEATQVNDRQLAVIFDGLDWIERYSLFASFRSAPNANIGYNGTMFDQYGLLTDVGADYLGLARTGNIPGDDYALGNYSRQCVTPTVSPTSRATSAPVITPAISSASARSSSTVATISSAAPAQPITTYASCPEQNGTIFCAASGAHYLVDCFTNYASNDLPVPNGEIADDFTTCIQRCDSTPGCVAVTESTGSGAGFCYMKTAVGPLSENSGVWSARLVLGDTNACGTASAPVVPGGDDDTTTTDGMSEATSTTAGGSSSTPVFVVPAPSLSAVPSVVSRCSAPGLHLPTATPVPGMACRDSHTDDDSAAIVLDSAYPVRMYGFTSNIVNPSTNGVSLPTIFH